MLSTAQTDVLLVVSGAPTGLLLARVAGAAALAASGRGVRTRLLIEEAAVVRRAGRALVGAAAAAGAAIRATPAVPASLLRVDHSVALGVVDPDAPAGLIVLRDPEALRLLDAQFELAWRIGIQPAVGRRPEAGPDPVDLAVLDALASGRKDEVAARQLGLSVRSLRRRVAQLMARLGAASRFEAGVRAAERGWVTAGRP
jgi:hypothetical protein